MTTPSTPEQRIFQAVLERGDRALGWTVARLPFDPHAAWTRMTRLRVAGEVNGCAFRTSLFADAGGYFVLVNRATQRAAEVTAGHVATFRLWPDHDERPANLPDSLAALLDEEEGLRAWYDSLSESTRRELGKWINGVQSEAAQLRRATDAAERLLSARDAELELPPLIARALAANGHARLGWQRMTPQQRRSELLAVFYYRSPGARERRVQKLVEAAARRGAS